MLPGKHVGGGLVVAAPSPSDKGGDDQRGGESLRSQPADRLGRLLLDAGRDAEAIECFEQTALAVDFDRTRDPRIIHNLAEIHMDRGDVARAIAAYARALVVIRKQDPLRGFGSLVPQYVHELEAARRRAENPDRNHDGGE